MSSRRNSRPTEIIERTRREKKIVAKTVNQSDYLDSIDNNIITFGIGTAGSGKTFLATHKAIQALKNGQVKRIIITRPAIEAGEKLGFLPGTLEEKLDPFLRPIFDAFHDIVGSEQLAQWLSEEVIEIAPLAFLRGRTFNDCFIICDEAQNVTPAQMKMFLTRLGYGSTMVVTGDLGQSDIYGENGLRNAVELFEEVEGFGVIQFSGIDVQRHPLVSKIAQIYEDSHIK